ncbi:uncharacterized protein BJ212DRAFT_1295533 [Suillus subaureus]|uniref:Uncharacterized protein n=1 Tax=Suillus subaureus TaxID=48587 RepID=A0A9P7ELA7_9AGAM|nr:uncharacterized protein BJ212DRAFT_1295533 [Suillus subaureus]KAG1824345.1 hypothetical protein BJ212DRAFT_1295533 [Suillus subaureus]
MSDYELLTQYTKDAYSREDQICDHPSCKANIRTRDPCFYVAVIEPGQCGHYQHLICLLWLLYLAALVLEGQMLEFLHHGKQRLFCLKLQQFMKVLELTKSKNICEGRKDINAQIDTPGLTKLALETIVPKLHKFGGECIWHVEEFPSHKGTKLIFKSKQFALMVVVPEVQWNEYENWLELHAEMSRKQKLPEQAALSLANIPLLTQLDNFTC